MSPTAPLTGDQVRHLLDIPFSEEQLDAITAPLEPAVIIAGAGTGKTTVMAARVVWLVGSGMVQPDRVLGLTFTRKAAQELGQRIRSALDRAGLASATAGEPVVSTYDSYAGTLAAEHGPRLGVERDLRLVSEAQLYALADRVVRARSESSPLLASFSVATVVERVMRLSSAMLANDVSVEQVREQTRAFLLELHSAPPRRGETPYADVRDAVPVAQQRLELLDFVGDLWEAKHHEGVVEFADRTGVAARLARTMPTVGRQQRETYDVVLLDEYQDTSAAQVAMLAGLFSGPTGHDGRGFPVTAVGDPLQAIYEWRGAAVGTMADFATTFPTAEGQAPARYQLVTNRRSTAGVRELANALSAPLRAEPGADTPAALRGPQEEPATPHAEHVRASWHPTRDAELRHLVEQVLAEHTTGSVAWSQMAVLTRTNGDLARVHAALQEAGIPATLVGLGGLLELVEVQQVVSVLRLVHDVTDNTAAVRLLSGPRWALGTRDLDLLGQRARRLAQAAGEEGDAAPVLMDAVADPGQPRTGGLSQEARLRCAQLTDELAELRTHQGEPVADLVERVVDMVGVVPEWRARDGLHGAAQVEEFVELVEAYAAGAPGAGLGGLLAWFDAELEAGNGLEQSGATHEEAVQLLTVHRSKGLEWEVVFLPSMVAGTFPSTSPAADPTKQAQLLPHELRGDADSLPELGELNKAGFDEFRDRLKELQADGERRLGYVAASRARTRVHVSGHHWRPGNVSPRQQSVFLTAAAEVADTTLEAIQEEDNPYQAGQATPWPQHSDPQQWQRHRELARQVQARAGTAMPREPSADADVEALYARWGRQAAQVRARLVADRRLQEVAIPGRLSVSEIVSGVRDPEAFRRQMLRPVPQPPSRSATLGTLFHEWVERRFAPQGMLGLEFESDDVTFPVDRTGQAPVDRDLAGELAHLCEKFEAGMFAQRQPHALEVPFALSLGGRLVRGRVDAVYREGTDEQAGLLVVDWKTHRGGRADTYQLALYRVAMADLFQVPVEQVRAGFYYVRADRLDLATDLVSVQQMEQQVAALTNSREQA